MFLIYVLAVTITFATIGMKLRESDRMWRWWTVGRLIRSDNHRHAMAPRLHHLKYMR